MPPSKAKAKSALIRPEKPQKSEQELRSEYDAALSAQERLRVEVEYSLKSRLEAASIKLHSIVSRVKSFDSMLAKTRRFKIFDPVIEMYDVVGVRTVCLFLSDIPAVLNVIRSTFTVIREDDKILGAKVQEFGYMSVHLVAEIHKDHEGPRYDGIKNRRFEIQVRTILMDAWANVSHHLAYKDDIDVPRDLRRDFFALSGLFYVADKHFQMFSEASAKARAELQQIASQSEHRLAKMEINSDTLTTYLRTRFPDREDGTAEVTSDLVRQLTDSGYRTIGDIESKLDRAWKPFLDYEKSVWLETPGLKYAAVGVIRIALGMLDERFNELSYTMHFASAMAPERWRHG